MSGPTPKERLDFLRAEAQRCYLTTNCDVYQFRDYDEALKGGEAAMLEYILRFHSFGSETGRDDLIDMQARALVTALDADEVADFYGIKIYPKEDRES
jgi:hypothetical protein